MLARAVFTNSALTPVSNVPSLRPRMSGSSKAYPFRSSVSGRVMAFGRTEGDDILSEPLGRHRSKGIRWDTPVPARDIVMQGFDKTGKQIVRDYAIEIAVLLAGSLAGVPGLKEFCQLAALILFFDCLFLFGFFASALTVMVEVWRPGLFSLPNYQQLTPLLQVRRIRVMRGLRRVDSSADLAHILDDGTTPDLSGPEPTDASTTRQRLAGLVLGTPYGETAKKQSPTARLKLLLISAFLILHALNLCTTLTAKTAFTRHSAASSSSHSSLSSTSTYSDYLRTDSSSTSLGPVLEKLSAFYPDNEFPLVIQVLPPVFFRLVIPGQSISDITNKAYAAVADRTKVASSMAILDRFMSGWTKLVGDPVLSKWIVIVLIVSVFLNGYLLKGIAVGDQGTGEGFVPSSAPEAATRLLLGGKPNHTQQKLRRRWSSGIEGLPKLQTEWTLADAAEMAKDRRKELIEGEKERDAAHAQAFKAQAVQKTPLPAGNDSSDESAPGSPLFMTTKKRSTTHLAGRLVSADEDAEPNGSSLPLDLSISRREDGKLYTASSASESQSERTVDTPATTIFDDLESTTETPTLHFTAPPPIPGTSRSLDEITAVFAQGKGASAVTDEEVILLVQKGKVAAYALEKLLKDNIRAVSIRRALICRSYLNGYLVFSIKEFLPQHAHPLPRRLSIPSFHTYTTITAKSSDSAARIS